MRLTAMLPGKWEVLGWLFVGIGVACMSHAAVEEYKAEHVWETAEKEAAG